MRKMFITIAIAMFYFSNSYGQTQQPWSLSYQTTEDIKKGFQLGPKDNIPDTMYVSGGKIINYESTYDVFTKEGAIVTLNKEGEVMYANKKDFIYWYKDGKETAVSGSDTLKTKEIEFYIRPILMEIEKM